MSTPPSKPTFILKITGFQKVLASISGSMFLMALVTMVPWIEDIFKPDFLYFLSVIRVGMAGTSFVVAGLVGIQQIQTMIKWIIDFYGYYKEFQNFHKSKEK